MSCSCAARSVQMLPQQRQPGSRRELGVGQRTLERCYSLLVTSQKEPVLFDDGRPGLGVRVTDEGQAVLGEAFVDLCQRPRPDFGGMVLIANLSVT